MQHSSLRAVTADNSTSRFLSRICTTSGIAISHVEFRDRINSGVDTMNLTAPGTRVPGGVGIPTRDTHVPFMNQTCSTENLNSEFLFVLWIHVYPYPSTTAPIFNAESQPSLTVTRRREERGESVPVDLPG
eukprot:1386983-Rhodomonas_salina.5